MCVYWVGVGTRHLRCSESTDSFLGSELGFEKEHWDYKFKLTSFCYLTGPDVWVMVFDNQSINLSLLPGNRVSSLACACTHLYVDTHIHVHVCV